MSEPNQPDPSSTPLPSRSDQDFANLGTKHPYLVYLYIVGGLFLFLIFMGFMAVNNGWIPNRGIGNP